jgi:ferrochelatase
MSARHTGLLLVNLGTPAAPTTAAVRAYLGEFLSDPLVIDIPAPLRFLLLRLAILPRRSPQSARAYQKVFTERGSPLLFHSQDLLAGVRERLPGVPVELAMRYGEPALRRGIETLVAAGVSRIVVFPLYPQFASSSTGSTLSKALFEASRFPRPPLLDFVPAFHAEPEFVAAFGAVLARTLATARADHVLFSFHGLPERHIRKADPSGEHCLSRQDCCATLTAVNRDCYRAQCFATATALGRAAGVDPAITSVAFQSRLGRTPWIQPFTDHVMPQLRKAGVKRLAVCCPSFVADCLETLEEIGIRAREDWLASGGEELVLVPSLNAEPAFCDAVVAIASRVAKLAPAAAMS